MVAEGLTQPFAQLHPARQPAGSGAGSEVVAADWPGVFSFTQATKGIGSGETALC